MKNYRRFRKWCEKNPHSTGEAAVQGKTGTAKKLFIAALCCLLLSGGVFGTRAFGSSADEADTAAGSVSPAQTCAAETDSSAVIDLPINS